MSRIGAADLQFLADNGFVVVKNFLHRSLQKELVEDVSLLRETNSENANGTGNEKNKYFTLAKIGHDGMIQDESTPFKDIRVSETCALGKMDQSDLPDSEARDDLYSILDNLKSDLQIPLLSHGRFTQNVPKLDDELEEIMYAYYPKGGYYRRHRDAEEGSISNIRKYSFLLYLNRNWIPAHGGHLRLHRDSGGDTLPPGELPNFIDVEPLAGTLVIFRSDLIPHEVLDTYNERLAIVGWFLSKDSDTYVATPSMADSPSTPVPKIGVIPINILQALRALRQASPRLKSKLEPSMNQTQNNQHQQSGLLGEDFLFQFETPKSTATAEDEAKIPDLDDTDPSYWKPIATFSVDYKINTLSLNGQRLRSFVQTPHFATLMEHVVTLDLGNTDLSCQHLIQILPLNKYTSLRNLHLAGFGVGQDLEGWEQVVNIFKTTNIHLLDLRYNDLGPKGASILCNYLQQASCLCRILHLEGNALQDEGTKRLLPETLIVGLQELYLGHNDIGPDGAFALASILPKLPQLTKLYMDGNHIGSPGANAFRMSLEATADTKVLEKLYVDNNGVGKEEAIALGAALNSATVIGSSAFYSD